MFLISILSFFIFVYISPSKSQSPSSRKLIFVSTHFRHGAREPLNLESDSVDILGEKWYHPGELTPSGQRMHYLLGLYNRQKYIESEQFLSKLYDPHEIFIYSTDFNRTIISALSQLQGLYPSNLQDSPSLSTEQIKKATPPVNIEDNKYFDQVIEKLGNNPLPNHMNLIPFHQLKDFEKKILIFDSPDCSSQIEKIKKERADSIEIKEIENDFNLKYGMKLNFFHQNIKNEIFKYDYIKQFCDCFISDYTDGREMKKFIALGLDNKKLFEDCNVYYDAHLRHILFYDEDKTVAKIDSSKLLREMLSLMKKRVDADIKNINLDSNFSDYSSPKMFMISGHDSSLNANQLFLINSFELDENEAYTVPKYASQIVYEVYKEIGGNKKEPIDYSEYKVDIIFNDKLIMTTNFKEFVTKIENNLWTDAEIAKWCGFSNVKLSLRKKNENSNNNESDNNKNNIIIVILSSLLVCSFAIILILSGVIYKNNHKINDNNKTYIINSSGLLNENDDVL